MQARSGHGLERTRRTGNLSVGKLSTIHVLHESNGTAQRHTDEGPSLPSASAYRLTTERLRDRFSKTSRSLSPCRPVSKRPYPSYPVTIGLATRSPPLQTWTI